MIHNREFVRKLQNAHADYIEAKYKRLALLPGNPKGIAIEKIGSTRIFLSNEDSFGNRAIFTGNESEKEFQQVTKLFDEKRVECFLEINPANFYRTEPFSWKSEVVQHLLELGYRPDGFRCVWYLSYLNDLIDFQNDHARIRRFTNDEAEDFIVEKLEVEPITHENRETKIDEIRQIFTEEWLNYIGYEKNRAVSISSLFIKNQIGYLAWGYTIDPFRKRGHHKLHVNQRARDAFSRGCEIAFSVTDFGIPSSISLQKCGFRLAYNYLLLKRIPPS
ncbi:MAG: hypothetical protein AAGD96_16355 [Chloroflexota bacterium]